MNSYERDKMENIVENLLMGKIEYERPELEISTLSINEEVDKDTIFEGSFLIRSGNENPLLCRIYSTSDRIVLDNTEFNAVEAKIGYSIDANGLPTGSVLEGFIHVVSDGGEQTIPVKAEIVTRVPDTSIGKVKNMFHFANYVQTDYDHAVELFKSENFAEVFLNNDIRLAAVYDTIKNEPDIDMAIEEFLIVANKKKRISLSLSETKKEYTYENKDIIDSVIISKDNWGYLDIKVTADGDFIDLSTDEIFGSAFVGSNYELVFTIKGDKLSKGINYGRIFIESGLKKFVCDIAVNNGDKKESKKQNIASATAEVCRAYLDFRTHRIELNEWADRTLEAVSLLKENGGETYMSMLIEAQVQLAVGNDSEASWLIESVANELIEIKDDHVEEYCFYLYVRSLQRRDPQINAEMCEKVMEYYDNGHKSLMVLWTLLYMDDSIEINPSMKLARIKEQYEAGMRSPIMYYEAAAVLCEFPQLLRVLNPFEVQVINFAVKYEFVTAKLVEQFADLAMTEKSMTAVLFRTMDSLYELTKNQRLLAGMISQLIRNNKVGPKYLKWYAEGIKNNIKIAGIYEHYIYSFDEEIKINIPKNVLTYFMYNIDITSEKLARVYAYVIKNKTKMPEMYNAYRRQIERYARLSMSSGRINKFLATIYEDVLQDEFITLDILPMLPGILCSYALEIKTEGLVKVKVIHEGLSEVFEAEIKDNLAYVHIYTEDAVIFFEDKNGVLYQSDIDYKMVKLFEKEELLKTCFDISPKDVGLCLHFAEKFIKYRNESDKSIGVLRTLLLVDEVRPEYKSLIEEEVVDYYYDNNETDSLDEFLLGVDAIKMSPALRGKILELAIIRGIYSKAIEIIDKFGYSDVEPRRLIMLLTKIIAEKGDDYDLLTLSMCSYVFKKGKYNEPVLGYMCKFYRGTTRELINIWEACLDFEYANIELEERLLEQMLFTGTYSGKIADVFESYYLKGGKDKISKAYLIRKSYDYFVLQNVVDERVFYFLEKSINNKDSLPDLCYVALLKYYSTITPDDERLARAKEILENLCAKNLFFEFYKEFGKFFKLPAILEDKTIVEYRTSPKSKVYINYIMENGLNEKPNYTVVPMTSPYPGIFTFEAIIFYGESLQYYITENVEESGKETATSSENLTREDVEIGKSRSKYGYINDILISEEMREESTLKEIAVSYMVNEEFINENFDLM